MRIVILAAGVGSRLGNPFPKPLTSLSDGRSILERALDGIDTVFNRSRVVAVVGFKKDIIMEAFPEILFAYNQDFAETNTSKSLLRALELTGDDAVLWMNGDVVFEPALMNDIEPLVSARRSFVCVNTASVGEEEVKYTTNSEGDIVELSKQVRGAEGEAVGINFVAASDKAVLVQHLRECGPDDYFERGIELAIQHNGMRFTTVDVSESLCIEVDFPEDLDRANSAIDGLR